MNCKVQPWAYKLVVDEVKYSSKVTSIAKSTIAGLKMAGRGGRYEVELQQMLRATKRLIYERKNMWTGRPTYLGTGYTP